MCVSAVPHSHHHAGFGPASPERRSFLKFGAAAAAGTALAAAAPALPARAAGHQTVVDLTHRLVRTFPSFLGPQRLFDNVLFEIAADGFYGKEWLVDEHIGTHIDTPGHFSPGMTLVDALDPSTLIAEIVVIDISRRAAVDPNATVEVQDLIAHERAYGQIPEHSLVCMYSDWASKVGDNDEFRGGTGFPDLNFPGFSGDAAQWLARRRNPVGIGVDTMSLDPGNSADFAVHVGFLATGRYGIENLANLDQIPARGATAFVGPIPWEDGSGSPCRVLATV